MNLRNVVFVLLLLSPVVHAQDAGPRSPAESLACIKVRPGFKVELMAAEPLVEDPIAFAWGPDGKFYVVEMGDYPLGTDGKNKSGGRIKLLTKSKADGPYDRATVFLDNLGYPTGVTPWLKGVLITCAPEILYAEDSDGDGKADRITRNLYAGFVEGNQQHRVNGLVYGLDNWFHGANGDSGGKIKAIGTKGEVDIRGRDFRIQPLGLIEPTSGQTQFGRSRDDWGNWFGNNNSNPMWHYVLEDRYLKRNPHVFYPDVRVQLSVKPGAAPVYPISKPQERFNNPKSLNHFTSACSAIIYRDDLFGPEFKGNSFVSEPVHNLIHREIVKAKGVTFTSQRAGDEQTSEFLASTDNWFRPTMLQTGPDGALWVADMYRHVIEHPQWIPADWQKKLDLRAGHDKGRIYRIYPVDKKPRAIPELASKSVEDLVAALESPNGWTRDMAQQVIVERDLQGSADRLRKCLSKSKFAQARLHALATLQGLNAVSELDVTVAAKDDSPGVRKLAIGAILSLKENRSVVAGQVARDCLTKETEPQVLLEAAYVAGHLRESTAGGWIGYLLSRGGEDKYLRAATLSSITKENWDAVMSAVKESKSCPPEVIAELLNLDPVFGTGNDQLTLLARSKITEKSPFEQFMHVAALLDGLDRNRMSLVQVWEKNKDAEKTAELDVLKSVFRTARETIRDDKAPLGDKVMAMKLLGRGFDQFTEDGKLLASFLVPQMPEDLQSAAVQSLARTSDFRVPGLLLGSWRSFSPGLRNEVLDSLLTRVEWARRLLAAIDKKQIAPGEIDVIRRQKLLDHKDADIRTQAAKLFEKSTAPERGKVIAQYLLPLLAGEGDAKAGSKLFAKHCAACHQLGGIGQAVGPDLASVADKTPEGLLTAILDPNRAVEARYINYVATTRAGTTLSGLLQSETSSTITLIAADGKKHGLLRKDLDDLASTGKSVMPEGFERDISPRDMLDLIAFLRGNAVKKTSASGRGSFPRSATKGGHHLHGLLGRPSALDDYPEGITSRTLGDWLTRLGGARVGFWSLFRSKRLDDGFVGREVGAFEQVDAVWDRGEDGEQAIADGRGFAGQVDNQRPAARAADLA